MDLRVRRLDEEELVRRVGATAMAQPEVTGRERQGRTREDEAGIGSRQPRPEHGVNAQALEHRYLRLDQGRVGLGLRWIITAGHVDLDVTEAVFREMSLQFGQCFGGCLAGHEPQVELGRRLVRENRLAAGTGVAAVNALDVHRRL